MKTVPRQRPQQYVYSYRPHPVQPTRRIFLPPEQPAQPDPPPVIQPVPASFGAIDAVAVTVAKQLVTAVAPARLPQPTVPSSQPVQSPQSALSAQPQKAAPVQPQSTNQAQQLPAPKRLDFTAPDKKQLQARHKSVRSAKHVTTALIILVVMMCGLMGWMALRYHKAAQKIESKASESKEVAVLGDATDDGVEAAPGAIGEEKPVGGSGGTYTAIKDAPTRISIPRLKVAASIVGVGVTKSGAMNVPGNIWQVGWYKTSAKPAENTGVVVMNGHVHGPTQPGIFADLKKLAPGDTITITDSTNKMYTYKVVNTATYKAGEANAYAMQSASPDKQGLNLITCTGSIKDDEYQDRLVVFTERS